jgi:Glycosyl transferase family 2
VEDDLPQAMEGDLGKRGEPQRERTAASEQGEPQRERIAACLIVQNEQAHLPRALASVAFCDEVIVVDGGSSDRTVQLARAAGARVIENPWPGYAAQRNVALDAASCDWILEVDADEQISAELRASIEALLRARRADVGMAVFALRHRFLGGWLGPSAKYPAYRSRLVRRSVYRHDESRAVHEGIEPRELPLVLAGDLEHELAATLREALLDTWRYARLESSHVARPTTARAYVTGIVLRPAMKLVYRTIVDGGWRDGWRGLLKISLDVGSDVLVWWLVLLAPQRSRDAQAEENERAHFGRRRAGPMRIVALAGRGRATQAASRWLAALHAQGADVTLIYENGARATADVSPAGEVDGATEDNGIPLNDINDNGIPLRDNNGIPLRAVKRLGPLATPRAVDIEMQLRVIDALVPFGVRARLAWRLLPGNLRSSLSGVTAETHPEQAFARAQDVLRSSE